MKKLFTLLTLLLCVASSAWADAETIYSMTAVTGPTGTIDSGTTVDVVATFVGGSAQAKNGKSSAAALVSNSDINLGGSGASFFHATLTSGTIAEGDIITLSASGTMYVSATSTKPSSSVTFPYTVPSGSDLIGKTDVYLWKDKVSRFSSFIITRPSADDVANPVIEQNGSSVSITCSTSDASIYYTTNGLEPLASGTKYNAAFTIDNSCTVRAIAIKGENASSIIIKDCYVSHPSALAVLCYGGGAVSGDVWTSTDGNYILTNNVEGRGIGYVNLAESQDGFKLNHTDNYTLQVGQEIKVTKIVVVGKSWLKGNADNAATLAFDGFTPASGTFFDFVDETYVKTIEFTPESELDYGATITMRPGKNQLGAWIEIYGVKRGAPADPIEMDEVTWDFTNLTAQSFGDGGSSYSFTATDGKTEMRYSAGKSDAIVAKNGDTNGYLKENGKTGSETVYDIDGTTNIGKTRLIRLYVSGKGKLTINCNNTAGVYKVLDGSATGDELVNSLQANIQSDEIEANSPLWIETTTKGYITSIVWTPTQEGLLLTTTATMQGWRSFYDANNSYTVDKNTKVYVATQENDGKVTLTEYAAGVPAGTPVILKTNASAENDGTFKMTLTKTTETITPTYTGESLLKVTPFEGNWYRLGSKNGEVGFFPFNATGAVAGIVVLNIDSSNAGARGLTFSFADDETTAIQNVNGNDNVNKNVYDLQGRRVAKPTKGMYIVNGKKVIIK